MSKRLKHIYRMYHQLNTDIWGNIQQYQKASKNNMTSHRSKLNRISIINGQTQKLVLNSKYEIMRQVKKYYLNVSKKFIDKIVNNKDFYIKKYNNIINILEYRLDTVIYRLNWACSLNEARQMISHGYIQINGTITNQTNLVVSLGDTINIKSNYIQGIKDKFNTRIESNISNINSVEYIEVNYNTMEAILIYYPESHEIPYPNINSISEIYNYIC